MSLNDDPLVVMELGWDWRAVDIFVVIFSWEHSRVQLWQYLGQHRWCASANVEILIEWVQFLGAVLQPWVSTTRYRRRATGVEYRRGIVWRLDGRGDSR